jgi:hypothetical protein
VAKYTELRRAEEDQRMARQLSAVPEVNFNIARAALSAPAVVGTNGSNANGNGDAREHAAPPVEVGNK